jgi:anti-anti-sigma factor
MPAAATGIAVGDYLMHATLIDAPSADSVSLKKRGPVRVLELCGNLGSLRWQSDELEASVLRSAIDELERPSLVIDLSQVEYGGAALLRCLVSLRNYVHENGGELVLSGVSEEMAEVLCLSNLDRVFVWHESVDQALDALSKRA